MLRRTVRIERKSFDARKNARRLRRGLRAHRGREVTAADAAAISGLPLEVCEPALLQLAREHPATLRVTSEGALLFRFASLGRSGRPGRAARLFAPLRRLLDRQFDRLLAVLVLSVLPPICYLIAIHLFVFTEVTGQAGLWGFLAGCAFAVPPALVLVVYGGCFGMLFASLPLGSLWMGARLLAGAYAPAGAGTPVLHLAGGLVLVAVGLGALALVGHLASELADKHDLRGVFRVLGGVFLGPARRPSDALADERQLTALLRRSGGVVSLLDLMSLFVWDAPTAEREVVRILTDYGGDILVTDDGDILYRFEALMASAGEVELAGADPVGAEAGAPALFGEGSLAVALLLLPVLLMGAVGIAFRPAFIRWKTLEALPPLTDTILPYAILAGLVLVRVPGWLWSRAVHRRRMGLVGRLLRAHELPELAPLAAAQRAARCAAEGLVAAPLGPVVHATATDPPGPGPGDD